MILIDLRKSANWHPPECTLARGGFCVILSRVRPRPIFLDLGRANGRGGFGSQTAADPPGDPGESSEKQTVGTVTASHRMLALQALSSSLNAGTAKRGCLGRGEAFQSPPAVCPPERPRPFARYRLESPRGPMQFKPGLWRTIRH